MSWIISHQIFRDSLRTCDQCGDSLLNHYKTYVHGKNAKLDVMVSLKSMKMSLMRLTRKKSKIDVELL